MAEITTSVRASELQAVLNVLADRGEAITVSYPFYNLSLFTYDPRKGAVTSSVDEADFAAVQGKYAPKTARLEEDLLQWRDLSNALLCAGAIGYKNETAIRERLAKALDHAGDAHNPNPTFLAFDTNTFYHRLATRGLDRLLPRTDAPYQLAVSQAVVAELDAAVANKYSEGDIQTLRAKLSENRRVQTLLGRPYKQGRRAKTGLSDVRAIEKKRRALRCNAGPTTADKEQNDRVIAASYKQLRETALADVLLFTADHDMEDHALAANLKPIVLQTPSLQPIPVGPMDERVFCRLVHELAIVCGAVRFVGADAWAWGIWSGKTPEDWDNDGLLLEHGEGEIMKRSRADVEAARRVRAFVHP